MRRFESLIKLFLSASKSTNKGVVFINGDGEEFVSYHNIGISARKALSILQKKKLGKGDKVILQCTGNQSFIVTMWACVLGGIIPIPLAKCKSEEEWKRLIHIWNEIEKPNIVLSNEQRDEFYSQLDIEEGQTADIDMHVILEHELMEAVEDGEIVEVTNSDIYDIQYSSGTSNVPKGVVITHDNVLNMLEMLVMDVKQVEEHDVSLSWLPLTHCFGYYMGFLAPMYLGITQILMETELFVSQPLLWLKYMSDYKVTISYAPNFAYNLVVKCLESQTIHVDLSSLQILLSGAEIVSMNSIRTFEDALQDYGLPRGVVKSVYGMSEVTVCISITPRTEETKRCCVDWNVLGIGETVVHCEDDSESCIEIAGVGHFLEGYEYKIAGEDGEDLGDERVGYLYLRSKTVMKEYYLNDAQTKEVLSEDGWLNTGDLGFISDRTLFLTGRAKEVMIVNGHNYYPQDLEEKLSKDLNLEVAKIGVCSKYNASEGTEDIFVYIADKESDDEFALNKKKIHEAVSAYMHADVTGIYLIDQIPVTASGKKQRKKLLTYVSSKNTGQPIENTVDQNELDRIEEKLFIIWRQVLTNTDFDKYDNFFSISGNSLKAVAVVNKIRSEFQINIILNQLFQTPTIFELADLIRSSVEQNIITLEQVKPAKSYALSTMQKSQFLMSQMEGSNKAYHITLAYEVVGALDERRLEEALQKIVDRHQILHTSFTLVNSDTVQTIENSIHFEIEKMEEGSHDTIFGNVHSYDLNNAPLFRVDLIKTVDGHIYLLIDAHHIVFDGVSVPILLEELKEFYLERELPELEFQYVNFAEWQKKIRATDLFFNKLTYWKEKMKNLTPMECWRVEPDEKKKGYLYYNYYPDRTFLNTLEKMASGSRTKYVVLMAAFHLLIQKYTGSKDIVVGAPFNGRVVEGTDKMIGMFVNTLPIRSQIDLEDSVESYLQQMQDTLMEAQKNQEVQYEEIIDELKADGESQVSGLYNTMLVLQNMPIDEKKLGTVALKLMDYKAHTEQFDVVIHIIEQKDKFWLKFEYNTEFYDQTHIEMLCGHYIKMVEGMNQCKDKKLKDISYLLPTEERQIMDYNTTEEVFPEMTLIEMWANSVHRYADKTAVVCQDGVMTYKELDEAANRVGAYLNRQEDLQSQFIAVEGIRSLGTIINILGIVKAGYAYIPINLDVPEKKLQQIMKDAKCNLLLKSDLYLQLEDAKISVKEIPPESSAYVIYTSGSTGNPKGVLISHKAVMNTLIDINQRFGVTEQDVVLGVSSFGFDLSVYDVFGTFMAGAELILAEDAKDMAALEQLVKKYQVTVWNSVPQILDIFLEGLEEQNAAQSIKVIMMSGDWIPMYLPDKIRKKCRKARIYSLGGATEASIWSIYYPIPKQLPLKDSVPYGMPLANQKIYILSEDREMLPIGMEGDIYIGGIGLADGYLNDEEKTNKAFVEDAKLGRIYKTGDRGMMHREGYVEFRGRKDLQVKIRGFRVELGEIENKMREMKQIVNAIVVTKKDDFNQLHLCSYYQASEPVTEQNIREYLASVLQDYMVPAYYVQMNSFPLTSNGKIARKNFPSIDFGSMDQEESERPATENEHLLVQLYKKVLHAEKIGINHNFFKNGGDSIKSLQLVASLKKYGKEIKMEELFNYPTVKELAKHVRVIQSDAEQGSLNGTVPLAPVQQWMLERQFEGSEYWSQIVEIRILGHISTELAELALKQVMQHHDALRFLIQDDENGMVQSYQDMEDVKYKVIEFQEKDGKAKDSCIKELCSSIDYKHGPLMTLGLFPKKEGTELVFVIHHLLVDTVSWMVILDDFLRVCEGLTGDEERVILPAKTVSYQHWIEELSKPDVYDAMKDDCAYWQNTLERASQTSITQSTERRVLYNKDYGLYEVHLTEEETERLQLNVIKDNDYGMQEILLLAVVKGLKSCFHTKDTLLQMEYHGRDSNELDVSRTVGWFTSLYPVIFNVDEDKALNEQLKDILHTVDAVPHKGTSYGILKYCFHEQWKEVVPDVTFNYLGRLSVMNDSVESFQIMQGQAYCEYAERISPVEINALMDEDRLTIRMNVNTSIIQVQQACALQEAVQDNLCSMCRNDKMQDEKEEFMKTLSDDVDIDTISELFF